MFQILFVLIPIEVIEFVILVFYRKSIKHSTISKDSLALKDTTYFEGLTIWSSFPRIFYLFPFFDDLPIKNDIIVQVSLLQNIMKPLQSCHFCAKHKNSLAVRLPLPSCQFIDSTSGWKVDQGKENIVLVFYVKSMTSIDYWFVIFELTRMYSVWHLVVQILREIFRSTFLWN